MVILKVKNGQGKNFMNDRIFIDSNILIYSIDNYEKEKQMSAFNIISKLSENGGILPQKNLDSQRKMQKFF